MEVLFNHLMDQVEASSSPQQIEETLKEVHALCLQNPGEHLGLKAGIVLTLIFQKAGTHPGVRDLGLKLLKLMLLSADVPVMDEEEVRLVEHLRLLGLVKALIADPLVDPQVYECLRLMIENDASIGNLSLITQEILETDFLDRLLARLNEAAKNEVATFSEFSGFFVESLELLNILVVDGDIEDFGLLEFELQFLRNSILLFDNHQAELELGGIHEHNALSDRNLALLSVLRLLNGHASREGIHRSGCLLVLIRLTKSLQKIAPWVKHAPQIFCQIFRVMGKFPQVDLGEAEVTTLLRLMRGIMLSYPMDTNLQSFGISCLTVLIEVPTSHSVFRDIRGLKLVTRAIDRHSTDKFLCQRAILFLARHSEMSCNAKDLRKERAAFYVLFLLEAYETDSIIPEAAAQALVNLCKNLPEVEEYQLSHDFLRASRRITPERQSRSASRSSLKTSLHSPSILLFTLKTLKTSNNFRLVQNMLLYLQVLLKFEAVKNFLRANSVHPALIRCFRVFKNYTDVLRSILSVLELLFDKKGCLDNDRQVFKEVGDILDVHTHDALLVESGLLLLNQALLSYECRYALWELGFFDILERLILFHRDTKKIHKLACETMAKFFLLKDPDVRLRFRKTPVRPNLEAELQLDIDEMVGMLEGADIQAKCFESSADETESLCMLDECTSDLLLTKCDAPTSIKLFEPFDISHEIEDFGNRLETVSLESSSEGHTWNTFD